VPKNLSPNESTSDGTRDRPSLTAGSCSLLSQPSAATAYVRGESRRVPCNASSAGCSSLRSKRCGRLAERHRTQMWIPAREGRRPGVVCAVARECGPKSSDDSERTTQLVLLSHTRCRGLPMSDTIQMTTESSKPRVCASGYSSLRRPCISSSAVTAIGQHYGSQAAAALRTQAADVQAQIGRRRRANLRRWGSFHLGRWMRGRTSMHNVRPSPAGNAGLISTAGQAGTWPGSRAGRPWTSCRFAAKPRGAG